VYQALYRKWRPMCFDDVIGQAHITKTLKMQSASGRLSHAYLFYGPRGTGKTTCARILAKAANCRQPVNGDQCNRCAPCSGINDGSITDVIEMDAATYTGVDDIRALRDEALYSPAVISRKVYIIDEVHMLSTNAFNAFLKILEEPPAHIMFILASTEIHKIPATVLSRCQRFEFKRIGRQDIAKKLMEISRAENIPLEESGAYIIAHIADGAMRNAISLLEQAASQSRDRLDGDAVSASLGLAGAKPLLEICGAVAARDAAAAIERFSALYASGVEPAAFCDQLLCLFRDIMVLRENRDLAMLGAGYTRDDLKVFFESVSPQKAHQAVRTLQDCLADMGRSANKRIDMEMCLLSLCDPAVAGASRDLSVEERLSALEDMIKTGAGFKAKALPEQSAASPTEARPEPRKEKPPENVGRIKDEKKLKETGYKDRLIASLRECVDMVTLSHLKLCAFLETDGKIVIKTENPMTYDIISRRDVLNAVAEIAGKLAGAAVSAEAERVSSQSESGSDGLDALFEFARENPDIAQLK
jgi:DNA polymerase-3 subunit gamma/tau